MDGGAVMAITLPDYLNNKFKEKSKFALHWIDSGLLDAYADGFTEGQSVERKRLAVKLEAYKADSVVAKLLLELMREEERC
jgi:hypothetical protein